MKKKSKKKGLIIFVSILSFISVCVASFFIYVSIHYEPSAEALSYLKDSSLSEVNEKEDVITFQPKANKVVPLTKDGLIFYPGGKVDYRAYAPLLRDLSDIGITSVLVKMPFHLAIFNVNGADKKQSLFKDVQNWYIGGHSLGGAMASSYLKKPESEYQGLILLGAYSTVDLTDSNLKTLSMLASNDKILNQEKYERNKKNLPSLTEKKIEGGIHSYFGDYGIQKGDGNPSISFQEQKKQLVLAISLFIYGNAITN